MQGNKRGYIRLYPACYSRSAARYCAFGIKQASRTVSKAPLSLTEPFRQDIGAMATKVAINCPVTVALIK